MIILPLVALESAALFTGAAVYINIAEHPARMMLDHEHQLAQWQPSYKRALPIQSGLAIVGGVTGFAAWYLTSDWRFAAGATAILTNWPFTLLKIMPVNKRLQATRPSEADASTRQMLVDWGKLHAVRGALGVVATAFFTWAVFDRLQ